VPIPLARKKYKRDYPLQDVMRQEHVTLHNVQISQLFDQIKKYLKGLKLDIIHEETYENYWNIKAHKGGKGSIIVGNVRDVEVMISGTKGATPYYDIVLRTGAWGKDILVPTAIAAAATAGIAAAPVAAIEAYRAHSFEKKFWKFISKSISDIGKGKATMSSPVTVTP
jgi:hypothetical protein